MAESKQSLESCSVGKGSGTECHKTSYTKVIKLNLIETLSILEKELLSLRSGTDPTLLLNVCEHHKLYYMKKYSTYQTTCFDPFQLHKKKITTALRIVDLNFSKIINSIPELVNVIPGQKICTRCRLKVQKYQKSEKFDYNVEKVDLNSDSDQSTSYFEKSLSNDETLNQLNSALIELGESPLRLHAVASHSRPSYAKRKIKSACSTLRNKVSKIMEKEIFPEQNIQDISEEIKQKAHDMDELVKLIKKKLKTPMTQREKIQILTLSPTSWNIKKVMKMFDVSKYAVRQARKLLRDKGILSLPEPRKGKKLCEKTVELVKSFYENDDHSRIMPGKKDTVSVSKNVHMSKRLLLSNLNELYASFKIEYPNIKIGFSKFCMLRPKFCVLAGSSGTHSVCVCMIHQNVNLLLYAYHITETYQDLISYLVCSKDSRDCMLRHCTQCPSIEKLRNILLKKFEDCDLEDEIFYNQWVSTDRTEMIRCTASIEEYLEILLQKIEKLIPHSYIAKEQSQFLKKMKTNLQLETAIVLLDFSENYSYVIQDEVQGYHWTNSSCTLHPAVIYAYVPQSDNLNIISFCVLSDDLEHDVAFVYETQKLIIKYIKEKLPTVKNVCYFSDGCAGQYKNCKNFLNLCYHEQDFALKASWAFFATSHGKSPCDGIGGIIKQLVSRESLQRTTGDVIDSTEKVLNFCKLKVANVNFKLISKETLSETRKHLQNRFSKAKTIPGTRGFHHFTPISEDSIGTKRLSSDKNFCSIFHFSSENNSSLTNVTQIITNSYIACVYDNHWFFGLILSKDEQECDVEVKFMHPYGPARSFYWPSQNKEDICNVPVSNIISFVSPPITKGSGRMYYFSEEEVNNVQQQYDLKYH